MFFCQINSFVVTGYRIRALIVCPSTGISDSNVYTNETGIRGKFSRGIPEFINSDEFSSSILIDPDHLDPSTLQRDQKE
jgi:hypothetical protein